MELNVNTLRKRMGAREFTCLVALLSCYQGFCTFALLPALPQIVSDFAIATPNDAQLVIGIFLVGNVFGQLIFGPLSDSFGRKPLIVAGLGLFLLGCFISLITNSFSVELLGRALQGLGSAAPRTVSLSIVRDLYSGRPMARVMSIVTAIFSLTPIIAPVFGHMAIQMTGWRNIFIGFFLIGLFGLVWLQIRQVESLAARHRRNFQVAIFLKGFVEVGQNPAVLIYSVAIGMMLGAFVALMSSAPQIFQDIFEIGDSFAYVFAAMAFSVVVASIINSKVVVQFGMEVIVKLSMICVPTISLLYFVAHLLLADLGLAGFITWGALCFFGLGFSFANLTTLAMAPLGHIAGLGSAIVGFITSLIAVLIGVPLGLIYNNTQWPLVIGFLLLGIIGLFLTLWAERYQQ